LFEYAVATVYHIYALQLGRASCVCNIDKLDDVIPHAKSFGIFYKNNLDCTIESVTFNRIRPL
jgi:uncharacterized membrane protein